MGLFQKESPAWHKKIKKNTPQGVVEKWAMTDLNRRHPACKALRPYPLFVPER